MVVSVGDSDDVLLGDESNAERVLQTSVHALAVLVSVRMQVFGVGVTSHDAATCLQRLHVDRPDGAALGVSHVKLDLCVGDYAETQP